MKSQHEDIKEKRAARLASRKQVLLKKEKSIPIAIIKSGNLKYGVEMKFLDRINPVPVLTPVPGAHFLVKGIINSNQEIYCVIDLAMLLGRGEGFAFTSKYAMILKEKQTAFFIEDIEQILSIPSSSILWMDKNDNMVVNNFIKGLFDDQISLLDIDAMLAHITTTIQEAYK